MNKKQKITKDDIIADVLKKIPKSVLIFNKFELFCVNCFASQFETIEQGARAHGKSESEIEDLVKKINEIKE